MKKQRNFQELPSNTRLDGLCAAVEYPQNGNDCQGLDDEECDAKLFNISRWNRCDQEGKSRDDILLQVQTFVSGRFGPSINVTLNDDLLNNLLRMIGHPIVRVKKHDEILERAKYTSFRVRIYTDWDDVRWLSFLKRIPKKRLPSALEDILDLYEYAA